MCAFFQMPYADWVFIPVPVTSLNRSSGDAVGNADGNTIGNITGSTAGYTNDNATHPFHVMPPPFMGHNSFAAIHPGHFATFQQGHALHPSHLPNGMPQRPFPATVILGSNNHGGVPQAFHPSLSVQTTVPTTVAPANDPSYSTVAVQTEAVAHAAPANDPSYSTAAVRTAEGPNAVQSGVGASKIGKTPDGAVTTMLAVEHRPSSSPNKKARIAAPVEEVPSAEEEADEPPDFEKMKQENVTTLAPDECATWKNGVVRFSADRKSAAAVLAWLVENTSRKLSAITTDALALDGFHNWDVVHAGILNDKRQLQHTFVISRAQRRRALQEIPGLAHLVDAVKAEIESLHLKDTPEKLEWLTGHILNQGDVNARFAWHQDTNEERKEPGGRRDRRVLYSAIVKLNRGGCTSMQVCGHPEVYYYSPEGSGLIFRSNLHHRTEKAEQGVWKVAMFFGIFF